MARRFISSPPGTQNHETVRQFQEVERAISDLERRVVDDLALGFIVPNFVFAAHGTFFNTTPQAGPDIPDPGWVTVDAFDTASAVKRLSFDTGTNAWTYENSGVYQVALELVLSHNESNGGRQFRVRLDDGSGSSTGVPVFVGRNQPGSMISLSFLQNIALGDPVRTFSVQVGGGPDAIGSVVWEATSVTISNVGAWIDELPDTVERAR